MLRLGTLETRLHGLEDALDRLPMGVALVDERGGVLALNRVAERIVAEGDGLWVDREGLAAASPRVTRELRRLIAGASAAARGEGTAAGGVLALDRPSGARELALLIAPLAREPGVSGRWPAAIVFVSDPEQADQPPETVLRRLYGLTRAEASLAAQLLPRRRSRRSFWRARSLPKSRRRTGSPSTRCGPISKASSPRPARSGRPSSCGCSCAGRRVSWPGSISVEHAWLHDPGRHAGWRVLLLLGERPQPQAAAVPWITADEDRHGRRGAGAGTHRPRVRP